MNDSPLRYDYDIALVFTAFQRNCIYASIIRELGGKYRIALLPVERDAKTLSRIGKTNRQFLDLCLALGVEIIENEAVTARIEILAQSIYCRQDIERINSMVQAERTFWMSGVAMGNASYSNLFGKKIDKILVPDQRLYKHRIATYGNDGVVFPDSMIREVGIPYSKYPLFDTPIDADYILANPTPFSFVTPQDRLDYLDNVYRLVKIIFSRGEVIAFKPHNADERADYIVDRRMLGALSAAPLLLQRIISSVSILSARVLPTGGLRDFFIGLTIVFTYQKIMAMVVKLSELTPYHNLNLEVFLPGVRKGLITGRSNSIWHALFLKKPVWNCIDREKPYFSDTKMHRYAMNYLNVQGNHRDGVFDETLYDVIDESTRAADLIRFLDEELLAMIE